MGATFNPSSFNGAIGGTKNPVPVYISLNFPPETQAVGYTMDPLNYAGREGVRMRSSIIPSPTWLNDRVFADADAQRDPGKQRIRKQTFRTTTASYGSGSRRTPRPALIALGSHQQVCADPV